MNKKRIENTCKGRSTTRNFVEDLPVMLELIQLVESEKIVDITLKSILNNVHRCKNSTPKSLEVARLI